jgi:excisionase family DNA binding protein
VTLELLKLEELAAILRVKPRTLRRHHDAGKIPRAIRIGSGLRWNRAAIEAWIAQGGPRQRKGAR